MTFSRYQVQKGFTLIELLVVIAIIAALAVLITTAVQSARNKAYTARALKEFRVFGDAMILYLIDNDTYPDDVNRDIPSGLEQYLSNRGEWPNGPYPGSVYDWDNIASPSQAPTDPYIQISLRFCDINGNNCYFPIESWAVDFDRYSSMYWCFEGPCRSHANQPIDHPGYCVNCDISQEV